ncbi:MAG: hypothetical protein AAGI23_17015 [Bacteroidota bacterium]
MVTNFGFIFAVFENNSEEPEEAFFDPKYGSLDVEIHLDAQAISESDQSKMQNIVARAILEYLEGLSIADIVHIDTDESLPDLDFDLVQFRKDLGAVFVAEEWLTAEELEEIAPITDEMD